MTTARALATATLLSLLCSGAAWAQSDQTGTGGLVWPTAEQTSNAQRDLVNREKAGVAEQGICIGCSAK